MLCKVLLLCYCFRTKFQEGANCLRGAGAPPCPPPVEQSQITKLPPICRRPIIVIQQTENKAYAILQKQSFQGSRQEILRAISPLAGKLYIKYVSSLSRLVNLTISNVLTLFKAILKAISMIFVLWCLLRLIKRTLRTKNSGLKSSNNSRQYR